MDKDQIENYKKAGDIAKQIKEYARKLIKPEMKLVDIAEKIESKIKELGAEIAFPVNLCIDDIAAHYTPTLDDDTKASGLLKVDIGVHVKGFIADTAFTIDLTKENKHKSLISATGASLANAMKLIISKTADTTLGEIGEEIHKTITDSRFSPVRNLSGHSLDEYDLHAGITIPNYNNGNTNKLGLGGFAIEPFATKGQGLVYEGSDSSIYHIIKESQPRDSFARQVLSWIIENKKGLPFSERELEKEFGSKIRLAIRQLENANIIASYPQLIEKSHLPVAQAENTVIIHDNEAEITTD